MTTMTSVEAETVRGNRADLFRALSDPGRLSILALVIAQPGITNQQVTAAGRLSQPVVSYHLGRLIAVGLVTRVKRTTFMHYTATPLAKKLMKIELS